MDPKIKPIMIYDGDCGFCIRWIRVWNRWTQDRVDYAPYQVVGKRFPQIASEEFERAVQFIDSDNHVSSGAEAVFRALATVPGKAWLLRAYGRFPGFAPATEAAYRFIANHRTFFSRLTRLFLGD